jgi:hypothetical protein
VHAVFIAFEKRPFAHAVHVEKPDAGWNLPAGHFAQLDAPARLYAPALQDPQALDTLCELYLPDGHEVHEVWPAMLNLPGRHAAHAMVLLAELNRPG